MKTWRVAICIMLIVCVLTMSISVFADDVSPTVPPTLNPENHVTINLQLASYFVWKMLDSWGIKIELRGYNQATDEILAWVGQTITDYAIDVGITVGQLIAPWLFNEDFWGNIIANDRATQDIENFAIWLKNKYNLVDNGYTNIDLPTGTINNVILYKLPLTIYCENESDWYLFVVDSSFDAYACLTADNTVNREIIRFVTYNPEQNERYVNIRYYVNGQLTSNINNRIDWHNTTYTLYATDWGVSAIDGSFTYDYAGYQAYSMTTQQWRDLLNSANSIVENEEGLGILTTTIKLPYQDVEYSDGDGVVIIDGKPSYQIVNIDSISIDNLPSIITQQSISDIGNDAENPGFSVPWQAINGLIQYVTAPAGAIIALINEAPIEGVIMLYALIGGIIIFGMIRIMREH